jgi:4'-phosphopantetheinyl transferase
VDLAAIPDADGRRCYGIRLLRALLGSYCGGCVPQSLQVRKTMLGAPYLPGANFRFSLSHSAELLLIAVCRLAVGVDVERLRELPASIIAARFLSPMEQRAWHGADDSRRLSAFIELWTRKEAYLKARGEGWRAPARAVNVCADPAAGHIDHAGDAFEQLRWRVFNFIPGENYVAALAVSSHPGVRCRWFTIAAPASLER